MINCSKLSGEFTRKISVQTNDPKHPKQTLVCKGKIMEAVTLKPKRISFRQVSRTATGQKERILITPGSAGPLKLTLEPLDSEFFKAELREVEAGKHYELEVTLTPPLPAKAVRAKIKLQTGLAEAPTVTIPLSAIPRPRVVASPRRFTVPAKPQANWRQAVRLKWDDDEPHRILGASTSDPGLKVKVVSKDGQQEVVLEIPEKYERRRGSIAVTVTTDDKTAPTVRVPVYFSKQAGAAAAKRARAASLRKAKTARKKAEINSKKRKDGPKKTVDPGAKAKGATPPPAKAPAPKSK